jgi:hypothetical protein
MATAKFWRDLALSFRNIPDYDVLRATWTWNTDPPQKIWELHPASSAECGQFEALAERGGIEINTNAEKPLAVWLDALHNDPLEQPPPADKTAYGIMRALCPQSSDLCETLAARAAQADAIRAKSEQYLGGTENATFSNPWHIWETNRDLPDTTAKIRLHSACKVFLEKIDSHIFQNKDLWRTIEKHLTAGQVLSYGEPNPDAMLGAFCKHCRWFLSEVGEALIEHISRRGLHGDAGIQAFRGSFTHFIELAYEHNWKWGLGHLRIPTVDENVWKELAEEVRTWKLNEVASLWSQDQPEAAERGVPVPKSEETPSMLVARRISMLEEYKRATRTTSNRRIYTARNSGIHKPQFHEWLKGSLEETSQTCLNFERFLREKKPPIPRKAE